MPLAAETEERCRRQLQEVLASRVFLRCNRFNESCSATRGKKPSKARLDDLKEYAIGVELFQKPGSYSPQIDPSVRVHSTRCAIVLDEYFRTEGTDSDVIIRLLKGSFHLGIRAASGGRRGESG